MKQVITFLILLFICSCASQQIIKEQEPVIPTPLSEIPTQTMEESVLPTKEAFTPLFGTLLSDVKISKTSFNPSLGEEIAFCYYLSKPAKVSVLVYDPDHGLIRMLAAEKDVNAGGQTIIWDGKDVDGNLVPDEAYFFTIMVEDGSGAKEVYDPTTFSGGAGHDITTADINPQSQTITYKMPEMGRVMIRMGIQGGPLMNQLVDWKPRVKGIMEKTRTTSLISTITPSLR